MGSTCPWEEIVDHVPQEKWEVEYKVYVTECSYSTRYFGSEDKQADTELQLQSSYLGWQKRTIQASTPDDQSQ